MQPAAQMRRGPEDSEFPVFRAPLAEKSMKFLIRLAGGNLSGPHSGEGQQTLLIVVFVGQTVVEPKLVFGPKTLQPPGIEPGSLGMSAKRSDH